METLTELGYTAFAFGCSKHDMHFASTLSAMCCSRPDVIEYLRAVILEGKTTLKTAYRFIGE